MSAFTSRAAASAHCHLATVPGVVGRVLGEGMLFGRAGQGPGGGRAD